MDYEKKYKEALERAKAMIKVADNQDEAIGFANNIFPELAESKDERIRKALIEMVHDTTGDELWVDYGIHKEEALAWLEKQGKPADINPSEFDLRLNRLLKQFETLPKEELASSLSFYLNVVQNNGTYNEEKQAEQKPTIEMITPEESLGIDSETYNKIVDECIYGEQKPTDEEMKRLLQTEYEKGRADAIAEMQKEWSEEDETTLNSILSCIKRCLDKDTVAWYPGKHLIDLKRYDPMFDWLKHLKQRIGG